MASKIRVDARWNLMVREHGDTPDSDDTEYIREFTRSLKRGGEFRVAYAIKEYGKTDPSPSRFGFQEWWREDPPPDALVCAAWATQNPRVCELANELENLRVAWYPDNSTTRRIKEIEQRLEPLLGS